MRDTTPLMYDRPKRMTGAERKKLLRMPVRITLPTPKAKRTPAPRAVVRARGPVTSQTYADLKAARRKGTYVRFQDRLWRVADLQTDDAGMFVAELIEQVQRGV